MRPAEEIRRLIEKLSDETSAQLDRRVRQDMLHALEASEKPSALTRPRIGRQIMTSPLTRLAVAAGVIVACAIGLPLWTSTQSGIVLADVAKRIDQTKNCVFKKTTTVSSEDGVTNALDSLVYYTENAARDDVYDNQKLIGEVYVKFPDGVLVAVDHKNRVFRKIDLADEDIEGLSLVSPRNLVDLILSKGQYKKLGRKTVDEVPSEGFEFNDKRAMLRMDKDKIKDVITRLWVDVRTNLPVRAEVDCVLTDNAKATIVMCDPKWDIELESDFFEPKIPVGYVEPQQRGLIGIDLENWPALKVVPGMAAEKAGVRSGDVVLRVNGNSISHITSSSDALSLLSGKVGEKIALTVKRGEQILTFEIERVPAPE